MGRQSPEEALRLLLEHAAPLAPVLLELDTALGRVLAEEVVAAANVPPFVNTAMDGYAVQAADIEGAAPEAPRRLRVVEDVPAGRVAAGEVSSGTAIRVMTGAPVPVGADTVVPVELTRPADPWVEVLRAPKRGAHLRQAGEDVRQGERVLAPGTPLRAAEIGLLAALGQARVRIHPAPQVAIVTTGDELVAVSEQPGPGQIRDANIHSMAAQVRACGGTPLPFPRLPDRERAVRDALVTALAGADVVITNGGVSVGAHDHIKAVVQELGARLVFWGVEQKPGSPLAFWTHRDKLIVGSPGNPVSVMVCLEEYVRPLLRRLQGFRLLHRPVRRARLASGYDKGRADGRLHFVRVHAEERDGELWASSTGPQGSGILSSMTRANALALVPADVVAVPAGGTVLLHMTDLPEDH